MRSLEVVALLLTPICHPAPPGSPGDVVRISDGVSTVFLLPEDFAAASDDDVRSLLARRAADSPPT